MFKTEIFRYLISGFINSTIGYILFIISLNFFFINIYYSNFLSYLAGVSSAFFLNKYYVFKKNSEASIYIFVVGFIISYFINLVILKLILEFLNISNEDAQLISMATYTITFYIYNKLIVFKKNEKLT